MNNNEFKFLFFVSIILALLFGHFVIASILLITYMFYKN